MGNATLGTHTCHAVDCTEEVPPRMHMCLKHWRMVPKKYQDVIWAYYRPGQEIDKQPSVEYVCVAFGSIACVALQEGKALPRMTIRRANVSEQ